MTLGIPVAANAALLCLDCCVEYLRGGVGAAKMKNQTAAYKTHLNMTDNITY